MLVSSVESGDSIKSSCIYCGLIWWEKRFAERDFDCLDELEMELYNSNYDALREYLRRIEISLRRPLSLIASFHRLWDSIAKSPFGLSAQSWKIHVGG